MPEEDRLETVEAGDDLIGLPQGNKFGGHSKIVVIIFWLVGGLAAIFLMLLISYFVARQVETHSYKESNNIVIAPAPAPLATFTFKKEFRVNTADSDTPHFVQASISFALEPNNQDLMSELSNRQIQMKHIINIILGDKKKSDLSTTIQKLNLAEEIKVQINMILSKGEIEEVYFEEFVVS